MRIGLCGTQSVGKTTLVKSLKELPEFKGYEFVTERSKYLNNLGIPLNTDSTLLGQTVFLAERASELMVDNIITDRTIIDVMAFAQSSKSMDVIEKEDFENYAKNLLGYYDYIFYVSPKGVDIENNGVRETNEIFRNLIDFTIQALLRRYSHRIKNIITIEGSTLERINTIKETLFL